MGFSSQDGSVPSSHHPDPHKAAHTVSLGAQGQGGHRKEDFYMVAHRVDCNRKKKLSLNES